MSFVEIMKVKQDCKTSNYEDKLLRGPKIVSALVVLLYEA